MPEKDSLPASVTQASEDPTAQQLRHSLSLAGRGVRAPAGIAAAALHGGRRRRRQRRAVLAAPIALVAVGAAGLGWQQPWAGATRTVPAAPSQFAEPTAPSSPSASSAVVEGQEEVPNVVGLSMSEATDKLTAAGFGVRVPSAQIASSSVAAGLVASQSSYTAPAFAEITITASSGPPTLSTNQGLETTNADGKSKDETGVSPQAVADALNAALTAAIPMWPSDSMVSSAEVQQPPGGKGDWVIMITGRVSTPAITLQVSSTRYTEAQAATWAQSPCQRQQSSDCTSESLSNGVDTVRGTEVSTQTLSHGTSDGTNGTLTFQAPYAEALLPGGQLISVHAGLAGSTDQPLRITDTFPGAAPVTKEALRALVTDPHLAGLTLSR